METKQVTLGLIQMSLGADASANLDKALTAMERAAAKGAEIVCLPELFTSPYFPQDEKADAAGYADSIPGRATGALSQAAADNEIVVVGGSIFEKDKDKFYNTSVVFDQKGELLGKYRKMHIPHDPNFYEQDYFAPGDGYRVFPTSYGKIAVLICYDQWYPEAARICALMGADMLFYPTAIGLADGLAQEEGDWQDAWTTVQRGHAIANGVVVAAVNRAGREGRMSFWGGSFVSSQFGTLLAKGGSADALVLAKVDLGLGEKVREGWRFLHNRRPETYARLLEK
jgi:agmatine deiminase